MKLMIVVWGLCWSICAAGQIPEQTVSRVLDLRRTKSTATERRDEPIAIDSFRGRYQYQVAGFRRLLAVEQHIRSCVDTQRMVGGEFHDRLDFAIEPDGKLKTFSARHGDQLQACLMPYVLPLRFPSYTKLPSFTLQVLVGSPGARLGRRPDPRPVAVYPLKSDEERKNYSQAVYWVLSPWTMAISHCAEWTDQTLGFGYKVALATSITPAGRVGRATLEVRGKLAERAGDLVGRCLVPFLQGMRAPPHAGPGDFPYRLGSTTAGWGIR